MKISIGKNKLHQATSGLEPHVTKLWMAGAAVLLATAGYFDRDRFFADGKPDAPILSKEEACRQTMITAYEELAADSRAQKSTKSSEAQRDAEFADSIVVALRDPTQLPSLEAVEIEFDAFQAGGMQLNLSPQSGCREFAEKTLSDLRNRVLAVQPKNN